jgi:fumarate reductase subunit C
MRKPYSAPQPAGWWWRHPAYRRYMLREATAVPLLLYALCLLGGLRALGQGEAAFAAWLAWMASLALLLLQVLALLAALAHAWTWFALLPKILVLRTPRGAVPGSWLRWGSIGIALLCWIAMPLLAWHWLGGGVV